MITPSPFYNVYGGTQDNNSLGGPAKTRSQSGIVNADWFATNGGDGFCLAASIPNDPNIDLRREPERRPRALRQTHGRAREHRSRLPGKGEESQRYNWDSPLIISPHRTRGSISPATNCSAAIIAATIGSVISGDLSRGLDRNELPVMGKIWGPDAVAKHQSTALYGNASALSESPKKEGLIYVGTDDGLIQVTEDGGKTWRKVEKFPACPRRQLRPARAGFAARRRTRFTRCSTITRTAISNRTRLKSTDTGKTWTSITGNLPERGSLYAIAEDHVNPNLLFVGTEFGLFLHGGWRREVDSAARRVADHRRARHRGSQARKRSGLGDLRPRLLRA